MYEVGTDIFRNGFKGAVNNVTGHGRLRFIYGVFLVAFIIFAGNKGR